MKGPKPEDLRMNADDFDQTMRRVFGAAPKKPAEPAKKRKPAKAKRKKSAGR